MKSARAGIVAAGAAIAAAGFTAGKKWDDATKTIVAGTGATGDALKGLQDDYQAVAKYGDGAATVIADLNTHLGLEGEALRMVAEAALKAKVDTNLFGDVASQLGLDAQGAAGFLDQLTAASQGTGVDIDTLTRTIGKSSARWQAAGGDMDDLAATVIKAADEFGPSGLRGAMSEIMQEVDKGLIPSISSLETQLGDTTGAVDRTYEASKTWRDSIREMKDGALAYLGPGGDMVGAIGSAASGLALAGPQMLKWIKGLKLSTVAQRAFNLAMKLNPIGLIVTAVTLVGLAIYTWRDQIFGFLRGAWTSFVSGLEKGYNFIARIVPGMEEVSFATKMQFEPAVEAAAVAVEHLAVEAEPVPSILDSLAVAAEEAEEAVDTFTGTVEDSSAALGNWGLDISKIGTQVDLIAPPLHDLTGTVEGQSAALDNWGLDIENIGTQVDLIPPKLGAVSQALGTFTTNLQTTFSAENVGGTIARAFEAGGSLMDAMKSIGAQMATNLGSFFSSTLSSIPIVGPFLAQFGGLMVAGLVKLGGKLWSSIKSLFGGPDEAEQAAREMFGGFHAGAVEALGGTQRYADEVQRAIDDGWDRTLAETRAGFILWGTDGGKTYDEAFADYERYQNAVKAGNTELMDQIEADYATYREASAETTEALVALMPTRSASRSTIPGRIPWTNADEDRSDLRICLPGKF